MQRLLSQKMNGHLPFPFGTPAVLGCSSKTSRPLGQSELAHVLTERFGIAMEARACA